MTCILIMARSVHIYQLLVRCSSSGVCRKIRNYCISCVNDLEVFLWYFAENEKLCNMACRLGLECCTRSCGCANCSENISASPISVKTTTEQNKYIAEIGMCGGKDDDESHCLQCPYISCCMGEFGSYVRIKHNVQPSEDCGKILTQFQNDCFGNLFEL